MAPSPPVAPAWVAREWSPLVDGVLAQRALGVVSDIVSAIAELEGLDAEVAMLMTYAAHAQLGVADDAIATERLEAVVAALAGTVLPPGLWIGLAGIGWIVAHLAGGDAAEGVCSVLDDALERRLVGSSWDDAELGLAWDPSD